METGLRTEVYLEHAMRAWGATVYRLALNQTRSPQDADDVAQDVFLSLLRDPTDFRDDEHLKAWLICVTVNRCRALHRSAWRRRVDATDESAPGRWSPSPRACSRPPSRRSTPSRRPRSSGGAPAPPHA